ncbi:MAG: hypothetical protein AB8G15_05825 [Saprospiraceae bacterium]
MFKVEILNIQIETLMIRFYLMMGIIIAAGFLNIWPLALFGLPVFLSALLGVRFVTKKATKPTVARTKTMGNTIAKQQVA